MSLLVSLSDELRRQRFFPHGANIGAGGQGAPPTIFGLDFAGNINFPSTSPSAIMVWNAAISGGAPFAAYPATYIWRAFPRHNKDASGSYWTFLFHAKYQTGAFDQGNVNEYYGMHPYPDSFDGGVNKWEISADAGDFFTDAVVFDQWYQQVVVVSKDGSNTHHKYYWNWPNVTTQVQSFDGNLHAAATNPAIIIGDAPWNRGNENPNAILRGLQFYDVALSEAEIAQEIAAPASFRTPWYQNLNPKPTDITDKSGSGHHPQWVDANRPAEWSQTT